MTTPDADAVAALAEAFKAYWSDPDMEQEDDPEWYARQLLANLPSGWTLARRSERDALVAALDRERVLRDLLSPAERPGAGYPCRRCGRRDMGHEPSCWYTRVDAAIEGRP